MNNPHEKQHNKGSSAVGLSRPDVSLRIVNMVTQESVNFNQLKSAIKDDIGLVMRTLRTANSAAYGLPRRVESIDRAVVLLGARTIGNIALAASMESTFNMFPAKVRVLDGKTLHAHSIAVATAAETICRYANLSKIAGEVFVAGLLHDVGIINLAWKNPEAFEKGIHVLMEQGSYDPEMEKKLMGVDHATEGMHIAVDWGLPPSICTAIAYHHNPLEAKENSLLVSVIRLAEMITGMAVPFEKMNDLHQKEQKKLLARLRISTDEWESLADAIRKRISKSDEDEEEYAAV